MATKPKGGGDKGLSGRATKKRTYFAASLTVTAKKNVFCRFLCRHCESRIELTLLGPVRSLDPNIKGQKVF